MPGVEARGFDAPDETRTPDKTKVDVVRMAGEGCPDDVRTRLEVVGVCETGRGHRELSVAPHRGSPQTGRMHVVHEDGTQRHRSGRRLRDRARPRCVDRRRRTNSSATSSSRKPRRSTRRSSTPRKAPARAGEAEASPALHRCLSRLPRPATTRRRRRSRPSSPRRCGRAPASSTSYRLDRLVDVDVDEPTELKVVHVDADVEMHTSYDVAPELAPQLSVPGSGSGSSRAVWQAKLIENAPGQPATRAASRTCATCRRPHPSCRRRLSRGSASSTSRRLHEAGYVDRRRGPALDPAGVTDWCRSTGRGSRRSWPRRSSSSHCSVVDVPAIEARLAGDVFANVPGGVGAAAATACATAARGVHDARRRTPRRARAPSRGTASRVDCEQRRHLRRRQRRVLDSISETTPTTCGVAMLVPWYLAYESRAGVVVPVLSVDRIVLPAARRRPERRSRPTGRSSVVRAVARLAGRGHRDHAGAVAGEKPARRRCCCRRRPRRRCRLRVMALIAFCNVDSQAPLRRG